MTETLRNKCDLFERNRTAISKKFVLQKNEMSIAAALMFTSADKEADIEKLEECRRILNRHTGFFSEYREAVKLVLLSEMSLSDDIAKTKRKCGIIERENYNLPKSENIRSPKTPKEKEEAIMEAFKHFQMI